MDLRILQQPCCAGGVKADLIAVLYDEPLWPQRYRPVNDVIRRLLSSSLVRREHSAAILDEVPKVVDRTHEC